MDTLEGLFKWSHDWVMTDSTGVPLTLEGKEVRVYQRVIGDADLQLARETALRASALQRKKLEEDISFDRAVLIPNYSYMDKGEIVALIVLLELPELRRQAEKELVFPYPEAPPSSASLEDQEDYQESIDTYFDRRDEQLKELINKNVEIRKQELNKLNKQQLRTHHESASIDSSCRDVFLTILNEFMAYRGTYLDAEHTKRAYSSFNSFRNASPVAKRQVVSKYAELELKGDQLKKSPEA